MSLDIDHDQGTIRRTALRNDRVAQLERMLEIRQVEECIQELFAQGLVRGTTHTCQGQEAISVALGAVTNVEDAFTCTYRGHGMALALGMSPLSVIAEVLGRKAGAIGGMGGSMHLSDPTIGLLPTFAIVGAGLPVAVGAAIARAARQEDTIAVAVFGDGATNIGAFHESMNLARMWDAPVLFVCENNLYGEYSRINTTTPFEDLFRRGASYNIPSSVVDGQDIDTLVSSLTRTVNEIRTTCSPRFVELKTYRFVGHSRSDTGPYRPPGELEKWIERDPITILSGRLLAEGMLTESTLQDLDAEVRARVQHAQEAALASPEPGLNAMFENIWARDEDT